VTKASDNIFPKVTFVEGSAPSSPSATDFHLYFDSSDHLLKYKDSSGTVKILGQGVADQGTFTYLDGTVGSAPATPASGKLRLYAKTGKVLAVKDDAGVETVLGAGGGSGALVFLEAHTASSSASLAFTSFISSTYDTYVFELVDVLPATNATWLIAHAGTGGGPTYDTGANYSHTSYRYTSGAASGAAGAAGDTSMWITNGTDTLSNDATWNGVSGFVKLYNPGSATYKKWVGEAAYRTSGSVYESLVNSGVYQSTTAMTAIRFQMVSGNIASGTIRVYGMSKT
jgi:hypothetical protein